MAKISRRTRQGELFYSHKPPIAVSCDLYNLIAGKIEREFGEILKKITPQKIKTILSNLLNTEEFRREQAKFGIKDVKFVGKGRVLVIPFTISKVSFGRYGGKDFAYVSASLILPLKGGNCGWLEKITNKIASEVGIELKISTREAIVEVSLYGEDFPRQIPAPSDPDDKEFRGIGRKVFVTEKEHQSGDYSPIIDY